MILWDDTRICKWVVNGLVWRDGVHWHDSGQIEGIILFYGTIHGTSEDPRN